MSFRIVFFLSFAALLIPLNATAGTSPIRPDYADGEVSHFCQEAIQATEQTLQAIAAIPPQDRTLDNTILAFEDSLYEFDTKTSPLTFMAYVSPRESVATEGANCEEKVNKFWSTLFTRKELYDAMKGIESINPETARLSSEILKKFEHNGMNLSTEALAKVKIQNEKLATLTTQFSKNLNADNTSLILTQNELSGVSNEFLARLKKTEDGKFIVTTKRPDYVEVMENVKNADTRKKMLFAYDNRAANQNTALIEDAISVRQELATLLGYSTWADYQISAYMAKDAKTVLSFLTSLKDKLKNRTQTELEALLKLKLTEGPDTQALNAWDIAYYSNQLKKRDYDFDKSVVKPYFPSNIVIKGLFEVYSKLLGIKLTAIDDASVWSPDVKLYRINDAKDEHLIGYFYADLFPRPGKYSHAAAFTLTKGRTQPDGSYGPTVSAIVANFNPPTANDPGLLSHDDVETLFHEFGHIMHQTLTEAPYALLSGTSVAIDFVEAPSQMLENWVWSPEILAVISGHYQNPTEKLPKEYLDKMLKVRNFNQGYFYTRQLLFGLLDMEYHMTKGPVDVTAIYDRLYKDLMGINSIEGGHFAASFGHLMGGYDAGYYGYLWSEVFADDMFTRFQKDGLLNSRP